MTTISVRNGMSKKTEDYGEFDFEKKKKMAMKRRKAMKKKAAKKEKMFSKKLDKSLMSIGKGMFK